jgi:hypothetical protein
MPDYSKTLEFMQLEQEFARRALDAAKNSPFPFILNAGMPTPSPVDYSWQPLLFGPVPPDDRGNNEG